MRRALFVLLAVVALALVSCNITPPVGDYNVTVEVKTSAHPYYRVGEGVGYVVNGVQGETLTLHIGKKVTFGVDTPGHPFYISTDKDGGSGMPGEVSTGVVNSGATFGLLDFTPDGSQTLLYYQCGIHKDMGWKITIVP